MDNIFIVLAHLCNLLIEWLFCEANKQTYFNSFDYVKAL